ncbi:hypothetical protein GCM10008934_02980 [Virgibacillus salarius]|uniref:hypothetical protein n=1 Tax=Virgibacillus salarius TaxID=447199 RepID=UPI0031D77057
MDKQQSHNLSEEKETIELPVFSKIAVVDNQLIGELVKYVEIPKRVLPKEDTNHEGIYY